MPFYGENAGSDAITPLIKLAIRLMPRAFFFLYPSPYTLRVTENNLVRWEKTPGFWKFFPWYISLFLISGMVGAGSCTYVVFRYIFKFTVNSTLDVPLIQVILCLVMCVFTVIEISITVAILRNSDFLLEFKAISVLERQCNLSLLKFKKLLFCKLKNHVKTTQTDIVGPMLLMLVFGCGLGQFGVTFFVVLTSIDPFYYVFDEFLPHPYQRGLEIILATWIARVILTATYICEIARFSMHCAFILTLHILMIASCVKQMLTIPGNKCIKLYLQLRTCFAWIFAIFTNISGILIFYSHFVIVFFFWFAIRCRKFVPLALLLMAILAGIFTVINSTFVFTYAGTIPDMSGCIIRSNRDKYFTRRENKVDKKYHYFIWWRSQCPVGIPCGSFFTIEKSFLMAYLRELAVNLANAVLLTQPSSSL